MMADSDNTRNTRPCNQKTILIICILVLAVAIGLLAYFIRPDTGIAPGTLRISQENRIVKTFTLDEIKSIPALKVQKTIASSKEKDESGIYTGVPLRQVLNSADKTLLSNCSQIVAKAKDGYTVSFTADEVKRDDNILVVYQKDGTPLKDAASGGAGAMRVLVQEDSYGTRCIKYLNALEIK